MPKIFYKYSEKKREKQKWYQPIQRPLRSILFSVTVVFFLPFLIQFIPNIEEYILNNNLTTIYNFFKNNPYIEFDMFILIFILYFSQKYNFLKVLFFVIITISLFLLLYKILHSKHLYESLHITTILMFTPFLFIILANKYFIDIPYAFFLKIHTNTLEGIDLFSSAKMETKHHEKNEIYIDIVHQTDEYNPSNKDKEHREQLLRIKTMYLRLIKFWYAQRNYSFKLRYYFPLLISIASFFYFFHLLGILNNLTFSHQKSCELFIDGYESMTVIGISLIILYLTMTSHINNFLHSKFYMSSILDELNKVYFDKHEYRQQLKLFLQKNFLIYIHDKNHDRHFCLNESQNFRDFITKEIADEEGRNLILTVYISFFMIFFIETSTGDLLSLSEKNCVKNTHTECLLNIPKEPNKDDKKNKERKF